MCYALKDRSLGEMLRRVVGGFGGNCHLELEIDLFHARYALK